MSVGTMFNSKFKPESPYVVKHMGVFIDSNCSQVFSLEDVVMGKERICTVDGCSKRLLAKGYCNAHYAQVRNHGKIMYKKLQGTTPYCSVDGCYNPYNSLGYCRAHYVQFKKYGYIHNIRPIKNEVRFEGDVCYIQTYDKYSNLTDEIIIDTVDYELVCQYRWGLALRCSYCYNPRMKLSRFLMGVLSDNNAIEVDHKNRNVLDNRRSNLRLATRSQNGRNRGLQKNNISGYRGVSWRKERNIWNAYITHNKKKITIGCFNTKEEAALAYNEKAIELHGEFAVLNKISI